jgi:hypothetical protein
LFDASVIRLHIARLILSCTQVMSAEMTHRGSRSPFVALPAKSPEGAQPISQPSAQ